MNRDFKPLILAIAGLAIASGVVRTLPARAQTTKTQTEVSTASTASTEGIRLVPPGGLVSDINDGAVSRDGRLIVTCGRDNTALVWEAATGRLVRRLSAPDYVWCAQFLPDGDRVIAGDHKGNILLWSVTTGKLIRAFTPRPDDYKGYSALKRLAVRADGKIVAVTWQNEETSALHVFNIDTGRPLAPEVRYEVTAGRLCFAPDNTLLVEDQNQKTAGVTASYPIAVIDAATGKTLRRINEAGGPAGFSPDKKRLLTLATHLAPGGTKRLSTVAWFDWQTGTRLKEFAELDVLEGITLSPDGTRFAAYKDVGDGKVREFSTETGDLLREMNVPAKGALGAPGATYTPSGDLLVAGGRGTDRLTRFVAGKAAGVIGGGADTAGVNTLSADGRIAYLITRENGGSRITQWDVRRNVPAGPPLSSDIPLPGPGPGSGPVSSPGGRFVFAFNNDLGLRVWNAQTGALAGAFRDPGAGPPSFRDRGTGAPSFSPDENFMALPNSYDVVEFSTSNGQLTRKFTSPATTTSKDRQWMRCTLYLNDKKRIVAGSYNGRVYVFDRATGDLLHQGTIHDPAAKPTGSVSSVGSVSDMQTVPGAADRFVFRSEEGYAGEYDIAAGKVTRVFTGFGTSSATGITCSSDGKTVAVGNEDGVIRLFDRASGRLTGQLTGHSGGVIDLAFSPGGVRLTSRGRDGTIRFFDVPRREELLTTLVFSTVEGSGTATAAPQWMVYNRFGFFEGSEGATRRVHFADGAQTFSADQFFERYFRAGLLAATLGTADTPPAPSPTPGPDVPSASEAIRKGAPPLVKIVSPAQNQTVAAGTVEITIEATEQAKGGVKAIRLYHNGRLVGGPSALRGIAVEAIAGATTTKRFTVALAPGANELKVVAYSNTDMESRPALATVTFALAAVAKPVLHVLSVGINTYKDASMNLAYARPDAESLADLFDSAKGGKAAGGMFASVQVDRLIDEKATGAAILDGIAALVQTAKPEDVVLVYLAGHGETAGDTWYFLPAEMRQMALTERVKEFGIPWPKIEAAIGRIQARKVILVLDACKSGAVVNGVRGGIGEQQAMAVMARAQGIHILTASNGQQYAGEVKALGHGILTYALLEGLSGKAGQSGDAAIMVRDVMSYVENRVPELSLKYRGEAQYPIPFDRGQNFPVASRQ